MIIRSRAPVRISFGGGGTDLAPYCNIYGGVVLSATINKYVYVTIIPNDTKKIKIISVDYKKSLTFGNLKDIKFDGDIDLIKAVVLRMKPEFGFDLIRRSDVPPNTGLGSSAAVAVATIGAFNHCRTDFVTAPLVQTKKIPVIKFIHPLPIIKPTHLIHIYI